MMVRQAVVLLAALWAAAGCEVTLSECDETWNSRLNQTFAYFGVAQDVVQLRAYWGNEYGCIAKEVNDTDFRMSQAACDLKSSAWSYGPGSIQDFVYYTNIEQPTMCLTGTNVSKLSLAPCCHLTPSNCTSEESQAQLWYEHPSSTDPYNRIQTNSSLCLTRCQ
eukprot:TRINITY_DN66_c2_g1_i1.p1 TRINITY_DN66_c2_g1~~TRINITY_DN66_c2_g1_i1.p1  ORF type:complete len:164 (+),score=17.79 TRINITY_DN66_c2_g1_i1:55-546(+)